jgi:hypothetical protein
MLRTWTAIRVNSVKKGDGLLLPAWQRRWPILNANYLNPSTYNRIKLHDFLCKTGQRIPDKQDAGSSETALVWDGTSADRG